MPTDGATPANLTLDLLTIRRASSEVAREIFAQASGGSTIKDLQVGKSDTYDLNPFDIHVKPGWNTRDFSTPENQQHVLDLAASIAARGVETALRGYVEDGKFWLTDGESRYRAVLHAINVLGVSVMKVPVRTEPRNSTEAQRLLGQIVRNTGKPLTPLERANVIARAKVLGMTPDEIATETGLTKERVRQLGELLEMPAAVQEHVQAGHISATEAARVVKQHGDAAPERIERAVALSSEGEGKRAGKATRKALAAVDDDSAPSGEHSDDDGTDLSAELERAYAQIKELQEQVDTLTVTDKDQEISAWSARYAQLNGRLQNALTEAGEAKRRADSHTKLLGNIRKALDVETNGDIVGAIYDLKR